MINNKIIQNASWLVVCRIIQAALSFVISLFTARYLGPSNYGLISYAAAVVAFVTPVANLGLNNILVQETIQKPEEEGKIYGTAIALSTCSSLMCIIGIFCFSVVANHGEKNTILVCVLYSLLLIFQAWELIQYWYQAKLYSKYTALISLAIYVIVSIYKVFLLLNGKSINWFAVSNAIDYMLISTVLFVVYIKLGGKKLVFSFKIARRLFSKSKYYIISNLMVTIFAQTDRIMLTHMVDEAATGYYSAAATCATATQFVFSAIIDSARPVVFQSAQISKNAFEKNLTKVYCLIIYLAFLQSVAITFFAPLIIHILYGDAYLQAVIVLQIIVWYTAFSYYGGAKDIWILTESKQKYLIFLNLAGAVANILLNVLLIPVFSSAGAAAASLVTQIFTNVIMGIVIKPLRRNSWLLFKAINPKLFISLVKTFIKKEK